MKKLGTKILLFGALVASISTTSCKSNGYGCDYGAIENEATFDQIDQTEEDIKTKETFTFVKYTKE